MTKKEEYKIVLPSARNVLDFVTEAWTDNLRSRAEATVEMPNLMQRAKLLVKKGGVLFLKKTKTRGGV